MKKNTCMILTCVVTLVLTGYATALAQTSNEILNKAIAFHDPLQKWDEYSGKVLLTTAWPDGRNSGGEIIEIRTKEDFYRCTRVSDKIVKGTKDGVVFREIEGNAEPDKSQIAAYGLGEAAIRQSKGWHYFHFGILMELKASGLVLEDEVETTAIQGDKCLVIRFTYHPERILNRFYENSNWTLYIDPADYALKGFKVAGAININAVFEGTLSVNDLKIPWCRTYYSNDDGSLYMIDLFSNAPEL